MLLVSNFFSLNLLGEYDVHGFQPPIPTGSIPTQIAALTNLKHLYLPNQKIVGSIPKELGSLVELTHLNLYNTNIEGTPDSRFRKTKTY